ncbi:P-type ATPase [Streptomyces sp. NPDC002996]
MTSAGHHPSAVTGENTSMEVGQGSATVGDAVNVGGLLVVRATAVGADTQLARLPRLVSDGRAGPAFSGRPTASRVSRLPDRLQQALDVPDLGADKGRCGDRPVRSWTNGGCRPLSPRPSAFGSRR